MEIEALFETGERIELGTLLESHVENLAKTGERSGTHVSVPPELQGGGGYSYDAGATAKSLGEGQDDLSPVVDFEQFLGMKVVVRTHLDLNSFVFQSQFAAELLRYHYGFIEIEKARTKEIKSK